MQKWGFCTFGESYRMKEALFDEVQSGATVHLPFEQLEPVDLAFDLTIPPGQGGPRAGQWPVVKMIAGVVPAPARSVPAGGHGGLGSAGRRPPYSPELNLIEILWKQIKSRWLPLCADHPGAPFREYLHDVLIGIGTRFRINHSFLQAV